VDNIVKPERTRQMIVDFYRHFSTSSCGSRRRCSTASGMRWRTAGQMAIGATQAIPVGGRYAFRDMGMLSWKCVVAAIIRWRRWRGR
jgi:hypothetical protein